MRPMSVVVATLAVASFATVAFAAEATFAAPVGVSGSYAGGWTSTTPYKGADLKKAYTLQLSTPYVCKWGTPTPGLNLYQSYLLIPPCIWITSHTHPEAWEMNYVAKGQMQFWMTNYMRNDKGQSVINTVHEVVPTGNQILSPMGALHSILNSECDSLLLGHTFLGATTEDFFSAVAMLSAHRDYLRDGFKDGGAAFNETNILSDGIHVMDPACMKRCGLTADSYRNAPKCPANMTLALTNDPFASLGKNTTAT